MSNFLINYNLSKISLKKKECQGLLYRGNEAGKKIGVEAINREACRIAKEVAAEGDALVLGGISQCPTYLSGGTKEAVQAEFRKQIRFFVEEGLDFLLCEVNKLVESTFLEEVLLEKDFQKVNPSLLALFHKFTESFKP